MPGALVVGYDGSGNYGEEHDAHREEVRKFGERVTAPALERAREAGVDASLPLIPERPWHKRQR